MFGFTDAQAKSNTEYENDRQTIAVSNSLKLMSGAEANTVRGFVLFNVNAPVFLHLSRAQDIQ
jgi:hypothetical protein